MLGNTAFFLKERQENKYKVRRVKYEERKQPPLSFPNSCLGTPVRETLFRLRSGTLSPAAQPSQESWRKNPLVAGAAKRSFAHRRSQTGVWERDQRDQRDQNQPRAQARGYRI